MTLVNTEYISNLTVFLIIIKNTYQNYKIMLDKKQKIH